jgi:hypothetical protein
MNTALVDPEVTSQKFQRELSQWKQHSDHQRRGWLLLNENPAVPSVELAFLAKVATSVGTSFLPVAVCAVRLTYENYDLWPPSLTFIDPFTREPSSPHVRAFLSTPEGPRDVLIDSHPDTKRPFLCVPGIREYHLHPQHTGDDWLLHRASRTGSISTICDRLWRYMVQNVVGLRVVAQTLPALPLQAQFSIRIVQGEIERRTAESQKPA